MCFLPSSCICISLDMSYFLLDVYGCSILCFALFTHYPVMFLVGPNKEWKPKVTNTNTVEGLKTPAASEGSIIPAETCASTQSVESTTDLACATNNLQKELEGLHVRDAQHVIIPNHIHVPDAVRTGLSFGSFDATFVIASKYSSEADTENSKSVSEIEQGTEETVEEATRFVCIYVKNAVNLVILYFQPIFAILPINKVFFVPRIPVN